MGVTFRENFLREVDGPSWAGRYGITTGADKLLVHETTTKIGDTQYSVIDARYIGTDVITLANYNGFPVGTIIIDQQSHKTHEKTGAITWASSAARA